MSKTKEKAETEKRDRHARRFRQGEYMTSSEGKRDSLEENKEQKSDFGKMQVAIKKQERRS